MKTLLALVVLVSAPVLAQPIVEAPLPPAQLTHLRPHRRWVPGHWENVERPVCPSGRIRCMAIRLEREWIPGHWA